MVFLLFGVYVVCGKANQVIRVEFERNGRAHYGNGPLFFFGELSDVRTDHQSMIKSMFVFLFCEAIKVKKAVPSLLFLPPSQKRNHFPEPWSGSSHPPLMLLDSPSTVESFKTLIFVE